MKYDTTPTSSRAVAPIPNLPPATSVAWCPETIVVTGTIGSGKSTVVRALKDRGAFVISADDLAHEALARGGRGLERVVALFGPEVLTEDGSLDRRKLGRVVFGDAEKKKALEAIVHPTVHERATEEFAKAIKRGEKLLVYECPLLFEAGLDRLGFKKIVVVSADEDVCVRRIIARSNGALSSADARQRIKAQMPADEKRARADVVIDNSGSLDQLGMQIDRLVEQIAES